MSKYSWQTPWQLRYTLRDGEAVEIPAQVPGNVLGDIVRAGLMPDPFYSDNSLEFRKFDYIDFEYSTAFKTPDFAPGETVEIVFGGVDTVAEYYLDGELISTSCNMFTEQRLDITDFTAPGREHQLSVVLRSAVDYARDFVVPAHARAQDYNYETLYLRKARHCFGWDIFPRLVGAGLWREVAIEVTPATAWQDIYMRTIRIMPEGALFYLNWSFRTDVVELDEFDAELVMRCKEQTFVHKFKPRFVCGKTYLFLPDPQLWWPAGSGEQNLYDCELKLYYQGKTAAVKNFHTAARTILLDYQEKAAGAPADKFDFIVNGQKIYVRGVNHVPVDALNGENADRRFKALEEALKLNCNMVRIWGGGVYEDNDFYDWCDRHGMMVWQDFMFACECPPNDQWYLDVVAEEAALICKKLRNHPSLAIFCGDNECDVTHRGSSPYVKPSVNKVTRQVLPDAVAEHAPETAYIASSPYLSDAVWASAGKYLPPELHPWGDRFDWKSSFYHDNFKCSFISEVGYPGINSLESLKKFLPDYALNVEAMRKNIKEWYVHASGPFADPHPSFDFRVPLLIKHVERSFREMPSDFVGVIEASQITHAEAMKTFVEKFRVQRGRCGGLMLWNLLDGWPQCTEALLDYYFERKKAYYYVQQAQQSLCMIMPEPTSWRATPVIVNDRSSGASGNWQVIDLEDDKVLCSGRYSVGGNSSAELMWYDHPAKSMQVLMLKWDDGEKTYYNHALLGNAPYDLELYKRCMKKFAEYQEK